MIYIVGALGVCHISSFLLHAPVIYIQQLCKKRIISLLGNFRSITACNVLSMFSDTYFYIHAYMHKCQRMFLTEGHPFSGLCSTRSARTLQTNAPSLQLACSEGQSTQYSRPLVPKTIEGMVFGTRNLKYLVLGPSGLCKLLKGHITEYDIQGSQVPTLPSGDLAMQTSASFPEAEHSTSWC